MLKQVVRKVQPSSSFFKRGIFTKPEVKAFTKRDVQPQQAIQQPQVQTKTERIKPKLAIPGIEHIIVVASGKGGVGKSTVSTNLALALSKHAKVGLLDADIYGPSIHRMMNVSGKPQVSQDTKKLIPKSNFGVKTMSMGLIVDEDVPAIWRGPMV